MRSQINLICAAADPRSRRRPGEQANLVRPGAGNYRGGASEEILGELLDGRRDRFVLATKYTVTRDRDDPNAAGNHRKNLWLSPGLPAPGAIAHRARICASGRCMHGADDGWLG